MKEFGFIRHGEKLGVGEAHEPIEQSGLSPEQQKKWSEALQRLGITDPEISYQALPKIERLAQSLFDELPSEARVVFVATPFPRTRFTADLLATELAELGTRAGKGISVSFLWEPKEVAEHPDSLSNVSMYPVDIADRIRAFAAQDAAEDASLADYFNEEKVGQTGSRSHPKEDEIIFQTANIDLASADSVIRKRAELIKAHYETLTAMFAEKDVPVYFFGVGHHQSLIALDVAFNGRTHYDSVDDMPKPLDLWKARLGG